MANTASKSGNMRYVIVAVLVVGAFFGAYQFAAARNASPAAGPQVAVNGAVPAGAPAGDAGTPACACCGSSAPTENGITGKPVEGAAVVAGPVQTIGVDLSAGYYQPNVIKLKAGVPAKITFGQGSGCTAQVMSKDLGFFEDLTAGPKTVKLAALQPGEYTFSCGMEMVFGKIVVE